MSNLDETGLVSKITLKAMLADVILAIIKLVTGFIFNSAAMISDGINSFTDLISSAFVLISVKFSSKPEDDDHNYGHQKLDVIASAFISFFIIIAGYEMFILGIDKFKAIYTGTVNYEISEILLVVALTTIVIKEVLYRYIKKYGYMLDSDILMAKAFDARTDSISTGTMLLGLLVAVLLGDKWSILDPVFAVGMSLYIVFVGVKLLKNSAGNLIDPSLGKDEIEKIKQIVLSLDGAVDPHNIRTLKLGKRVSINMHIRVDAYMTVSNAHCIATALEKRLREEYGEKSYIYVHIEPIKTVCISNELKDENAEEENKENLEPGETDSQGAR